MFRDPSVPNGNAAPREPDLLHRLEQRLSEAMLDLADRYVDPREAWHDSGGDWHSLGWGDAAGPTSLPFATEVEHRALQHESRALVATNPFAANALENRVSYIVGSGHTYQAIARKCASPEPALIPAVQALIDEFLRENRWHERQQEMVRRLDRDGEVFLRFFVDDEGRTQLRFVEPALVSTPGSLVGDVRIAFGVQADPDDSEAIEGYYVAGEFVPAAEIQHRKANVDMNVRRGLPLLHPVRRNLRRAEKLLRNMSVVAEIQSAIALIRRHASASRAGVQRFVGDQADATLGGAARTRNLQEFGPGTILDAHGGVDYQFPAAALDAGRYVTVLQAELRAIASRLVMPEFMLTSDASNGNYASTMVAEGPAIKMFERLQAQQEEHDLAVFRRVLAGAVGMGRLPPEALCQVEIAVGLPTLAVRDLLQEAQTHRVLYREGILSPQSWAQRAGLDYDQEQANWQSHRAQGAGGPTLRPDDGSDV